MRDIEVEIVYYNYFIFMWVNNIRLYILYNVIMVFIVFIILIFFWRLSLFD